MTVQAPKATNTVKAHGAIQYVTMTVRIIQADKGSKSVSYDRDAANIAKSRPVHMKHNTARTHYNVTCSLMT